MPPSPKIIRVPQAEADAAFDEVLQGRVCLGERGAYYHIERPARELDAEFELLGAALQPLLPFLENQLKRPVELEDLLFVDIETTGLSPQRPLFLIGTLGFNAHPRLRLFLARHYDEEAAVLEAFSRLLPGKVLLSFNGRFFDWPYIENRSRHHRMPPAQPRAHFDLLPHARKHWKRGLPNCRLQTLESHYCGRLRQGDIPGARIPGHYQSFALMHGAAGTGAHLLLPLIYHNYWDVLTMAELLIKTWGL